MVARITQLAQTNFNLYYNDINDAIPNENTIRKTVNAVRERIQQQNNIEYYLQSNSDRVVLHPLPTESKYFKKESYKLFNRIIFDNEETNFIRCSRCTYLTYVKNREGSAWFHVCNG